MSISKKHTMNIQLSEHFTYKKLISFSLSPICSMVFTSLYGIVDGYFVSNYTGASAFAALNLVMPFIMMVSGVGFMFGSGGSALVALHLGKQEKEKANRYFSLIVYTALTVGIILGVIGYFLSPMVVRILGATKDMIPYGTVYLQISMLGIGSFMLQQLFQNFLIAAEKPKLGFRITLVAGCSNMFFDWLLVGYLKFGIAGAAWATILSQVIGGVIPFILFAVKKDWSLHLGRTSFELSVLTRTCGNGISEFLSNVSISLVGFLYNFQLLKFAGEDGVSAFGVIMYVSYIFVSIDIGYTMGMAPVVSYHDGAQNTDELKSIYRKSLRIIFISNVVMVLLAELSAGVLSKIFVGYDPDLYSLTVHGLMLYSISFLLMGYNVFGSAFFTALNNGRISAILSVARDLVLEASFVFLLPLLFGINGVWCAVVAVEVFGSILTTTFLLTNGKKYGYR